MLGICVLLSTLSGAFSTKIQQQRFIDEYGRTQIFHGMNAVYKISPWIPNVDGFDPENSLSDIDATNLKSWGFNIIRLGN
jgi:endoglycosylceramidase